jgi:hypothetical protein
MSNGEDRVREIAELGEILEERIAKMESEIKGMKAILNFVNKELIKVGFRKISISKKASLYQKKNRKLKIEEVELKTVKGVTLASIGFEDNIMYIQPSKGNEFNINTPPFRVFLLDKVLSKMAESDKDAVQKGTLEPDKALTYNIETEGEIIKKIIVRGVSSQRKRDLKSAVRWTLEKMYEKKTIQP